MHLAFQINSTNFKIKSKELFLLGVARDEFINSFCMPSRKDLFLNFDISRYKESC